MSLKLILKIVNFCLYVKRSIFSFQKRAMVFLALLCTKRFQKLWILLGKTHYEMAFFHKKCLIFQCIL